MKRVIIELSAYVLGLTFILTILNFSYVRLSHFFAIPVFVTILGLPFINVGSFITFHILFGHMVQAIPSLKSRLVELSGNIKILLSEPARQVQLAPVLSSEKAALHAKRKSTFY